MNPIPSDLRSIRIFASLTDDELVRLATWFEVRSVETGERLIVEGASGFSFFVIQEGTADVLREGRKVGTLKAGEFFGEGAMLDSESARRNANVVATSPMTIAWMFGANFRQMQEAFPEIAERVAEAAQQRAPN